MWYEFHSSTMVCFHTRYNSIIKWGKSQQKTYLNYLIFAPNGKSANLASFIHCSAKGIPIMVIAKKTAITIYPIAISQPIKSAQMIFAIGCLSMLSTVSFPKGVNTSSANLKHCLAKGIPIIVIANKIPNITNKILAMSHPNIKKIIFPRALQPNGCSCNFANPHLNTLRLTPQKV